MRYLITTVPQVDGGSRKLYARTRRECDEARVVLRDDPAAIECITVAEIEDVARDGSRTVYVRDRAVR